LSKGDDQIFFKTLASSGINWANTEKAYSTVMSYESKDFLKSFVKFLADSDISEPKVLSEFYIEFYLADLQMQRNHFY
jgi:hypothetical protein